MRTHKSLGVAEITVHKSQQAQRGEGLRDTEAGKPLESRVWSFGEGHCAEQGWAESKAPGGGGGGRDWVRL